MARVKAVYDAAESPQFDALLNARLAAFDGQPVSHHQVRDAIHGVLGDMSVAREGVAITVDWWPAEMRLTIWARPEHATVAKVAEGLQVLPTT